MDQTKKNIEYSVNDYRDYLEHSWGKKPEQKAREKEYNRSYYLANKEKWKKDHKILDKLGLDDKWDAEAAREEADSFNKYTYGLTDELRKNDKDNYDYYSYMARQERQNATDYANEYRSRAAEAKAAGDHESAKTYENLIKPTQHHYYAKAVKNDNVANMYRDSYNNLSERQYSDYTKKGSELANRATAMKNKYSKTPLGKAENAINAGKKAISDLLKKFKKG